MLELLPQEVAQQPLDDIRDWWQHIERWRARQCLKYDTQSESIKPQAVIEAIWRLTKGDAYVTSDVGPAPDVRRALLPPLISRVAGLTPAVSARWALACQRLWA
ncbi:acetolactate synthase 3 catalytic subunit [Citrobacter koseri]|uniref:Acetolactate synthase 3 catalytic subunit n=1 Tax=Citrobacter koseri TaxID=545 RepID=A0A2X2VB47_CITKO|nr:acetolactate synthase 3 catalytic subunit [Citrobacter koseri]